MTGSAGALPRLLYVGDVPVEASYHGSALLYRLLEDWPADRLAIIETAFYGASLPARRLPGVSYRYAPPRATRLQSTRFNRIYTRIVAAASPLRALALHAGTRDFAPASILTVAQGHGWLVAAHLARRLDIPLHVICHDDWLWSLWGGASQNPYYTRLFTNHYRAAASRLCVSPGMAAHYEAITGAPGQVLYPSRARAVVDYKSPPARLARTDDRFRMAWAGTITRHDTGKQLEILAGELAKQSGELHLFGPVDSAAVAAYGLDGAHVHLQGLIPSADLIERLRAEIDALFVPMSFSVDETCDVETSFPSKLTDYSATGLPMLIRAPANSSAARWATEHPGVAELVTDPAPDALAGAIHRLATDPAHRMALGATALTVGNAMFSFGSINAAFQAAIMDHKTPAE